MLDIWRVNSNNDNVIKDMIHHKQSCFLANENLFDERSIEVEELDKEYCEDL